MLNLKLRTDCKTNDSLFALFSKTVVRKLQKYPNSMKVLGMVGLSITSFNKTLKHSLLKRRMIISLPNDKRRHKGKYYLSNLSGSKANNVLEAASVECNNI